MLNKIKLMVLWIVRVLFAPNHFRIPLHTRIRYAIDGGYMVDQVAMYDLKHNDKEQYLSEFDWYKSRSINDPYSHMLNNKVVFAEMIKGFCPTPELFAVKKDGRIAGMNGRKIVHHADLISLLREEGAFVVKPVNIGKGLGIHIVRYNGGEILDNGKPVTGEELIQTLTKSKSWLICAFAKQAEYLDRIYAGSANTIRMIVLRSEKTREFELCFAVQRIGASWTGAVDNGSRGGLIAKVCIETGELTSARTLHNLEVYPVHPDTQSPIEGVVIPDWENIKAGVLEASSHFPYLDIIAWDILPTPDGFTVIEGNTSSGVNIIQLWGGERYGKLGDFYRRHGIIK